MPTFDIPCDVYARLASITDTIYHDGGPFCKTLRVENGKVIATNRKVLAIERVDCDIGTAHILVDPNLVAQCRTEAQFDSILTVTIDHSMRFGTAKTTFGYNYPGNVGYWSDGPNELADWKNIVPQTLPTVSDGAMLWDAKIIAALGLSSPTGGLVFPEFINASEPVLIRDVSDDRWCGIFLARPRDTVLGGATIPEWLR